MWNRAVREGNEHYQDQQSQQQQQPQETKAASNAAKNNTTLPDAHNHIGENMECVNTSLLVLRFIRFALYHGAPPTQFSK